MSSLTTYNGLQVVTPEPSGTGGKAINNNFKMISTKIDASNPTSSDDSTHGYGVGSRWFNRTTQTEYICLSNAHGAASWVAIL